MDSDDEWIYTKAGEKQHNGFRTEWGLKTRKQTPPIDPGAARDPGGRKGTQVDPKDALLAIERIYAEVADLQEPGYRYAEELHRVAGYTAYLEDAMTDLGRAMAALRDHLEGME